MLCWVADEAELGESHWNRGGYGGKLDAAALDCQKEAEGLQDMTLSDFDQENILQRIPTRLFTMLERAVCCTLLSAWFA